MAGPVKKRKSLLEEIILRMGYSWTHQRSKKRYLPCRKAGTNYFKPRRIVETKDSSNPAIIKSDKIVMIETVSRNLRILIDSLTPRKLHFEKYRRFYARYSEFNGSR